ncbi:MAG TPA: NYN domain-containing protein [Opitutaceae bacterium]|nr:NYN domain-containing protein [Opitutaceae bacterium]
MKKTAILIDGGWFTKAIENTIPPQKLPHGITADIIYKNALLAVDKSKEEVVKIFYYDSSPHEKKERNPISKTVTDYALTSANQARKRLFTELGKKDFVALRRGVVKPRGWTLTRGYAAKLMSGKIVAPQSTDVFLNFEQKGVDMRIGIDVATLAIKRLVDRIILLSGDTDMVPAIKLARREGIQVILAQLPKRALINELVEDADLVRNLNPIS